MNENPQKNNLSTVVTAALVGGLAGAVVGLLFAPKRGRELRQDIREKGNGLFEHIEETATRHTETLKQQGTDGLEKMKQMVEDLHTFMQEFPNLKKTHTFQINPHVSPASMPPVPQTIAEPDEKDPTLSVSS